MSQFAFLKEFAFLAQQKPVLQFCGTFTQKIIEELVANATAEIEQIDGQKIAKKVFRIFIEMAQNVLHHSHYKNPAGVGKGFIAVFRQEGYYRITSCNAIDTYTEELLKLRLAELGNYHDFEFKTLANEILKDNYKNLHGGAGLGLIDIRRCSEKPLKGYFFSNLAKNRMFVLEVELPFMH